MESANTKLGLKTRTAKEEEARTRDSRKAIPAQAATRIALFPEEGDLLLLEISPILLVNQHEV